MKFKFPLLAMTAIFILPMLLPAAGQGDAVNFDRAFSLRQRTANLVDRDQIRPQWLPDHRRFWYRVQTGADTREFILVDAEAGTRRPAFDHAQARRFARQSDGHDFPRRPVAVGQSEFSRNQYFNFRRRRKIVALQFGGLFAGAGHERRC